MYGVPESMRGKVWKYLLGVSQAEKTEEASLNRMMAEDYESSSILPEHHDSEMRKVIRTAIKTHRMLARIDSPFFNDQVPRPAQHVIRDHHRVGGVGAGGDQQILGRVARPREQHRHGVPPQPGLHGGAVCVRDAQRERRLLQFPTPRGTYTPGPQSSTPL
jgi:hypothetical protein